MSRHFLDIARPCNWYRPGEVRIRDWDEVEAPLSETDLRAQARRCMDCGVPFCHGYGCPLRNVIPEINSRAALGDWRGAWELLRQTSPMPEFTSRVCPALCENSCCAGIDFDAVAIRQIEKAVVERAFASGWVVPNIPARRNGRRIAIIGSGPAGMAAAIQLNQAGYRVEVFEKQPLAGGLLRYGIPAFKLSKAIIDRRLDVMRAGGVEFHFDVDVGRDISVEYLAKNRDAVVFASGTPTPRDLNLPGRELAGISFALDYFNSADSAAGQNVVIIGGGDTGADCVGTAARQGAASITQLEILPEPPAERSPSTPWPEWAYRLRFSSSHHEAGERRWSVQSVRFLEKGGRVSGVEIQPVLWELSPAGKPVRHQPAGKSEIIPADRVLLAMGFSKPELRLERENMFAAGDAATGQSLVVRAIADALDAAERVRRHLEKA